jgi:hypothetical protein
MNASDKDYDPVRELEEHKRRIIEERTRRLLENSGVTQTSNPNNSQTKTVKFYESKDGRVDICGNCSYHRKKVASARYECRCEKSELFGEKTAFDDRCYAFVPRGGYKASGKKAVVTSLYGRKKYRALDDD